MPTRQDRQKEGLRSEKNGRIAETQVLRLLERIPEVEDPRKATPEEDQNGEDLVFNWRGTRRAVQVKVSNDEAKRWRRKAKILGNREHIVCVSTHTSGKHCRPDEEIIGLIFSGLVK